MVWMAPKTWSVGEEVDEVLLNLHLRDMLIVVDQHSHGGGGGDGTTTLGDLVKATLTDAAAPAAPGGGLTSIYAVSSRPHYRAGAAGADTELSDANDLHSESHASRHKPSGADAMAVDAAVGVGSLRTLGSGALQIAAGNHTHA